GRGGLKPHLEGSTMEYRNLGNSGLKVSAVGLGCNNFGMKCDAEQTRAVVHKALGERRRDIIVATKFGMAMGDGPYLRGGSRRYVVAAAEASLKRLGTGYID